MLRGHFQLIRFVKIFAIYRKSTEELSINVKNLDFSKLICASVLANVLTLSESCPLQYSLVKGYVPGHIFVIWNEC